METLLTSLIYTPLLLNSNVTAAASDYYIGVKLIKINQINICINASLLAIDNKWNGGTKISTLTPYTVLQTSNYNALTGFFRNRLSRVPTVAPFRLCFNSTNLTSTLLGPGVPAIDLVIEHRRGELNLMVQVGDEVLCLGLGDGGSNSRTSIVIGGYQIDYDLLQFDLGASRLGFSSSLLYFQTTCANFNFTSNA